MDYSLSNPHNLINPRNPFSCFTRGRSVTMRGTETAMKLSEQKVQEVCGRAERALADFDAAPADVAALHAAHEMLGWLRTQYPENRDLLDVHLPRLKSLRERMIDRSRRAAADITAAYIEAAQAASAWEKRREDCRDLLVELAEADKLDRLDSGAGHVEVRRVKSAMVPKADTPQRAELHALLDQSQRWADVASVNSLRLMKAIDSGLFSPLQVGQLMKLCPMQISPRLVMRTPGS